jgi:hypothetical protein
VLMCADEVMRERGISNSRARVIIATAVVPMPVGFVGRPKISQLGFHVSRAN